MSTEHQKTEQPCTIHSVSNSGFLDDLLFNHTMNFVINEPNDFQKLINELYSIVEKKFKPQLYAGQPNKDVKAIMDRTFKSWDLFVSRLEKKEYMFADLVKKYSYKQQFFSNEKLKDIYESL